MNIASVLIVGLAGVFGLAEWITELLAGAGVDTSLIIAEIIKGAVIGAIITAVLNLFRRSY